MGWAPAEPSESRRILRPAVPRTPAKVFTHIPWITGGICCQIFAISTRHVDVAAEQKRHGRYEVAHIGRRIPPISCLSGVVKTTACKTSPNPCNSPRVFGAAMTKEDELLVREY